MHDVEVLFLRSSLNSREIYGYFDNIRLALAGSGSAAQVPEPVLYRWRPLRLPPLSAERTRGDGLHRVAFNRGRLALRLV